MKLHAIFSLRYRLLLLVLIAVLPSLWLILHTAAEHRRGAAEEVKSNALRVVRFASAGEEKLIEGAHQLLIAMAHIEEIRGESPQAASAVLNHLLRQYSTYLNFGVIDLDGSVFASAKPLPPEVNLKDRGYFIRAIQTGDFTMGDFQVGRILNIPSVNFGYPVRDESGKIIRVVFAAFDLTWLERLAARADLPPGATLSVVDSKGIILAGWPEPEKWRGKALNNPALLPIIQKRHEGTAQMVGPDRVPRLMAFTHLRGAVGTGFVSVSLAIPDRVAFAEPNRILKQNLAALGLVTLMALAAAWFVGDFFILRRLRVLVKATHQLELGDLSARTGLRYGRGEISHLAQSFDQMATTLEQRSAERDRAENALKTLNEDLEQRIAIRTNELREKNEQFEADLELAREFQVGLLPVRNPHFCLEAGNDGAAATVRFAHLYEASGGVGGDYFKILQVSPSEIGLLVCDVMGHGVRAALVTAILRGLEEELKTCAGNPAQLLGLMNEALVALLGETRTTLFTTATAIVADLARKKLRYTNAGHPKPLRLRRRQGIVEAIPFPVLRAGPALGLFKGASYPTFECDIEPGDAIFCYTDGVFEVANARGDLYGEERLLAAVSKFQSLPLEEIYPNILAEIRAFAGGVKFEDDLCIVGFEWSEEGSPVGSL